MSFTLPERKRRILLAEDEEQYYSQLIRILTFKGYEVTHVKTAEEALIKLYFEHFHVVIMDVWLNDGNGPPEQEAHERGQGVRALEVVSEGILKDVVTRIIFTNYPDIETFEAAVGTLGIFRMKRKFNKPNEEDYVTQLLAELDVAFDSGLSRTQRAQARIHHSPKLDLEFEFNSDQKVIPQAVEHIVREEGSKLLAEGYQPVEHLPGRPETISREVLALQIYDVLQELFYDDEAVYITLMSGGLTGASVLRAQPSSRTDGVGQRYVVKVGRRSKIEREYNNYMHFIDGKVVSGAVTALTMAVSRNLGAIRYRFAENDSGAELREFDTLFNSPDVRPEVLANSLDKIFDRTFRALHMGKRHGIISIPDSYYEAFELTDRGNLQRIVDELQQQPEVRGYIPDFDPHDRHFEISIGKEHLLNPIWWLNNRQHWCVMPAYECVTHGDFTGRNIMADPTSQIEADRQGNLEYRKLWLIDFYRTGRSHILRDHVVLESDIKYRLLEDLNLRDFIRMEKMLLELEPTPDDLEQTAPDLYRGLTVLRGLRRSARLLQGNPAPPDDEVEFLLALLMATLNVVRLKHVKPTKKLHAMLSASLICSRIEHLKTGSRKYPELQFDV